VNRYQLSFGLFLVSSLGFAEPLGVPPQGVLGQQQQNLRQQQFDALQLNQLRDKALQDGERQVRDLEGVKSRNLDSIAKVQDQIKDEQAKKMTILEAAQRVVIEQASALRIAAGETKDKTKQAIINGTIEVITTYFDQKKDNKGKLIPSPDPKILIETRKRFANTDELNLLQEKAIQLGKPDVKGADGKPLSLQKELELSYAGPPRDDGGKEPQTTQDRRDLALKIAKFVQFTTPKSSEPEAQSESDAPETDPAHNQDKVGK
jgi:hypothetical protein